MKAFFALSLVLFISLGGCEKSLSVRERREKKDKDPVPVKTETVTQRSAPRSLEVITSLAGQKQVDVYSRVPGKIAFVGPQEGQPVKAGEVLFRVDRTEPGESFLTTPVVSPISGWIGRWLIDSIGEQVSAQEAVVTVLDDEILKGIVSLPTQEWLRVTKDTPVRMHLHTGGQSKNAQVIDISRSAEARSSRGIVTVTVNNRDHSWRAGMVAFVTFDLEAKTRMLIPVTALSLTDQGSFVFVVGDENKAKRQKIRFEMLSNDWAEVSEGLREGQLLITDGTNRVTEGVLVRSVSEDANTL